MAVRTPLSIATSRKSSRFPAPGKPAGPFVFAITREVPRVARLEARADAKDRAKSLSGCAVSRFRKGRIAIECVANSSSRTVCASFRVSIWRPMARQPMISVAARLLATSGLRLLQRQTHAGGETGRAMMERPSSQRSRSSARSAAEG